MFRLIASALVLLGIGLVHATAGEGAIQREHERLEGTWRVVSAEVGGMAIPAREFRDLTLTFKAGKFVARRGQEEPQEGTYNPSPTKNPREMDITRSTGPMSGPKQLAIYQLTGNLLKICSCVSDTERPTSFDTREQPGWTMMTLRRVP
jgi:uncharacterized protein (TIGR03067 family)